MLTPKEMLSRTRKGRDGWLPHSRVLKGASTAKPGIWSGEAETVHSQSDAEERVAKLYFILPAAGPGHAYSSVQLQISSKDFPHLLALMSATDRDAALKAMADELRCQICGED